MHLQLVPLSVEFAGHDAEPGVDGKPSQTPLTICWLLPQATQILFCTTSLLAQATHALPTVISLLAQATQALFTFISLLAQASQRLLIVTSLASHAVQRPLARIWSMAHWTCLSERPPESDLPSPQLYTKAAVIRTANILIIALFIVYLLLSMSHDQALQR
ncbi:MAG: hypothetical protein KJP04_01020 [Arenicella sp.]|nr:hypothetical protein [Arenicella sp.]